MSTFECMISLPVQSLSLYLVFAGHWACIACTESISKRVHGVEAAAQAVLVLDCHVKRTSSSTKGNAAASCHGRPDRRELPLQDAGLLALVAAANVVSVPAALPIQDFGRSHNPAPVSHTALPVKDKLTVCHSSAPVSHVESLLVQTDSAHKTAQSLPWGLPGAKPAVLQQGVKSGSTAAADVPVVEGLPGRCGQPCAARKRRRKRRDPLAGITPEHMLYWVSQADIAAQLRCDDSAAPVEAGLLSGAASAKAPNQEECADTLPAVSAEEECSQGCQTQSSRMWQEVAGGSKVLCTAEPVLYKSLKRRQCW